MTFDISKSLNHPLDGFLVKITPHSSKVDKLTKIREEVRNELREKFSYLSDSFENINEKMIYKSNIYTSFLDDDLKKLSSEQKKSISRLKPKFASQGSFVYKTMNSPCQSPQQMDLDDGIYLPLDMFEDKPVIGKELFFNFVDRTLSNFAELKGWGFSDKKNTCARIFIDEDLHIDVPLYAVPSKRYEAMLEKAMNSELLSFSSRARLEPNEVNLALRNAESWTVSDPAVLNDYFKSNFIYYRELVGGEDVCRRVCRYFKAWRDHIFKDGGPSSVALMTCVVLSFQEMSLLRTMNKLSDGDALLECAKRLPQQLLNGVPNDAEQDKGEMLFPKSGMLDIEINEITEAAESFYQLVKGAVNSNTKSDAIGLLNKSFGNRYPKTPELIIALGSVSAVIRSQPAQAQPQPNVVNQDAG
jgi:hypothetical protein